MSGKKRMAHSNDPTIAGLTGVNRTALESASEAYQEMFRTAAIFGSEGARFCSKRIEEDIHLVTKLCHCQTPADALQTHISFVETMMADYLGAQKILIALIGSAASRQPTPGRKPEKKPVKRP